MEEEEKEGVREEISIDPVVPFVTDDNCSDSPELLSETIPRRRRKRWRGNAKGHQPWPCIGS
uniref:Uncharacterized protein n=1 Tax=Oryza sativa subsp. japonica TaxID=39947 RepID=Q6ESU0_ORYSJ|nr:hypothetical protein [Oryza sativa Japonica Group]